MPLHTFHTYLLLTIQPHPTIAILPPYHMDGRGVDEILGMHLTRQNLARLSHTHLRRTGRLLSLNFIMSHRVPTCAQMADPVLHQMCVPAQMDGLGLIVEYLCAKVDTTSRILNHLSTEFNLMQRS